MEYSKTDVTALELSNILEEMSISNSANMKLSTETKNLPSYKQIVKTMLPRNSPTCEQKVTPNIDADIIDTVAGLNIYKRQVLTMDEIDRITCYYPQVDKLHPPENISEGSINSSGKDEPYKRATDKRFDLGEDATEYEPNQEKSDGTPAHQSKPEVTEIPYANLEEESSFYSVSKNGEEVNQISSDKSYKNLKDSSTSSDLQVLSMGSAENEDSLLSSKGSKSKKKSSLFKRMFARNGN